MHRSIHSGLLLCLEAGVHVHREQNDTCGQTHNGPAMQHRFVSAARLPSAASSLRPGNASIICAGLRLVQALSFLSHDLNSNNVFKKTRTKAKSIQPALQHTYRVTGTSNAIHKLVHVSRYRFVCFSHGQSKFSTPRQAVLPAVSY